MKCAIMKAVPLTMVIIFVKQHLLMLVAVLMMIIMIYAKIK